MEISKLNKSCTNFKPNLRLNLANEGKINLELSFECPLLNPNLPPVTDMDHNIRNCFCYMCACGKHDCPANYRLKQMCHSNHFKTNYKLYYKKPILIKSKMYKPSDHYVKPNFPIEKATICQSTYIPHIIETKEKEIINNEYIPAFRFRGKSVYASEYKN